MCGLDVTADAGFDLTNYDRYIDWVVYGVVCVCVLCVFVFFFNDTATTEIYTE